MVKGKLNIITALIIGTLLTIPIALADEESTLEKVDEYAQKIKDLLEKYEKAEIDFVKQEVMTITDTEGNPQDCDVAIFYNNGKQARFTTKNGKFDGNFNHAKTIPTRPYSIRLSNCACVPISTTHTTTWMQINEMVEKIKEVIESETTDYASDKAKELAEKGIKKVFEKIGYGAAASGFLSGFGAGAALGAPIGEYITENINKILDTARELNVKGAEHLDYTPLYPNVGWVKPRGRWGNWWGENPQLKNTWNVKVKCGTRTITPDTSTWTPVKDLLPKPQAATPPPITKDPSEQQRIEQERKEQERIEREERAREEREQREREEKAKREQEEARKRYEEEQRKLRLKAQEIMQTCPLCDPIRKQIEQVNELIKNKEQEIPDLEKAAGDAQAELNKKQKDLANAQQKLNDFKNPRSWVESDGRRVTSTDLEVQRQLSIDNWQRYKDGEQTAQETMDNWANQNDPAKHEEAKKNAEQRLEKAVKDAEQAVKDAQQKLDKAKQDLSKAKQQLENLKKELDRLRKMLEDCLKKCKEYALQIAQGHYRTYEDLLQTQKTPEPTIAQTQDPCTKYEKAISTFTRGKLSTADYESLNNAMKLEFVTPEQMKAIQNLKEECGGKPKTVIVSTPQQEIISTEPITEQPKSCEEICNAKSMTTKKPDWSSYILNKLNSDGVCKKSASINYGQILSTGGCTCYSTQQPSISISSEQLICKGTICGDIQCGNSAQCSCGDNCVATVECKWGGWKQTGDTYQAQAGITQT